MATKKKKTTKLTMKQREKMLLTPCKTKDELKKWIKYHLRMDIPDHTVSRHSNTNPLDAIWQIYDVCEFWILKIILNTVINQIGNSKFQDSIKKQ